MPRKKVEENHKITESDFIEEPAESSTEDTSAYAEDMSPPAADITEDGDTSESLPENKEGIFIKLVKGSTFHIGDYVFKKGNSVPVDSDFADKLIKTGFFERA